MGVVKYEPSAFFLLYWLWLFVIDIGTIAYTLGKSNLITVVELS